MWLKMALNLLCRWTEDDFWTPNFPASTSLALILKLEKRGAGNCSPSKQIRCLPSQDDLPGPRSIQPCGTPGTPRSGSTWGLPTEVGCTLSPKLHWQAHSSAVLPKRPAGIPGTFISTWGKVTRSHQGAVSWTPSSGRRLCVPSWGVLSASGTSS